jgi:hypothetical protein
MTFLFQVLRFVAVGAFGLVMCVPLILSFLTPRQIPIVYPPYYPPEIQRIAAWLGKSELMMSDMPWAVAWYGKRQCLWLTLDTKLDFFKVNDYLKPIHALYLTPLTLNGHFRSLLSELARPEENGWGSFILAGTIKSEIPRDFPLRKAPSGLLPEQFFLTDWERWRKPADGPNH